ncbi:type III secretion system (T3SS) SseB-like protein [Barrientosiimonas humi]|uniref:Type III secretion system (T3SS) SseB-like protein n=1 Tax=Barrientosiimonas humi TaxID=999931 RepID=A0A542XC95_9MICO|nr:SseB family protein [Barrientosiimonas humi]TQL33460.1 type III secretion system (T3SS) SseB-like protein [Barrientosiimonas humi]CAG7573448.1 hypothetical protein BH39T_PBIAJDOK_02081 [Barrientosiimonas humi]
MTVDSGGQGWHGRSLSGTGFDGDSGETDPRLLAALRSGDEQAAMRAIAAARLLVPIVAAPGEGDDTGTDMAAVTLRAPDGQQALPVFTGVAALAAWDAAARPTPVTAARAAQAAVSERCDVMVVDVADEHPFVLRPSMVWALAQDRPWLPAYTDPVVQQAVSLAARDDDDVRAAVCESGDDLEPGLLRIVLSVPPGRSAEQLQQLATRIGERLATDGEVRARIDGITFSIQPA